MRLILTVTLVVLGIAVLMVGVSYGQEGLPLFLPLILHSGPNQATATATATQTAGPTPPRTATPTASPTPTLTATPVPGGSLTVENYQTYVDQVAGGLHVVGEIVNGTAGNQSFLRADITLLQDGQPVYQQTQPSLAFSLRPGQRSPFDASLGTPPNYNAYTVAATGQSTAQNPVDQFTILSQRIFTETTNTLALVGELRNDTSSNVTLIAVTGTFYQADGLVWRANQSYTLLRKLAPGQRAPFKLAAYGPQQIASSALLVGALNTAIPPRDDLTVLSSDITVVGEALLISGQVRNDGATPANSVQVVATLLDSSGQIVNAGASANSTLAAGATGPFAITIPGNWQGYATVELQAQGS